MVKGNQKVEKEGTGSGATNDKYVGFTLVKVAAVNPTRAQLNKLLGKEDSDNDVEIVYTGEDKEGRRRSRLSFWMLDEKIGKYFIHSFNVTEKERISNDGKKYQFINNVATTSWSDVEANLSKMFTEFQDKEKKKIGDKKWRKAFLGEDELAILLRVWLGQLNFYHPDADVSIDMENIFDGDFTELQNLVDSGYDKPFVILTGVQTDENDPNKQYQKVWNKGFLPGNFMPFIENGMKGASSWISKTFAKFEEDVTGQYGFTSFYTLEPLSEYNKALDVAASDTTRAASVTPVNSKY